MGNSRSKLPTCTLLRVVSWRSAPLISTLYAKLFSLRWQQPVSWYILCAVTPNRPIKQLIHAVGTPTAFFFMEEETFNNLTDSQKIKTLLNSLGRISQEALAKRLGCSARSITRWIAGSSKISRKHLAAIKSLLTNCRTGNEKLLCLVDGPLDSCSEELDFLKQLDSFSSSMLLVQVIAFKLCAPLDKLGGLHLKLSYFFNYTPTSVRIDVVEGNTVSAMLAVKHIPTSGVTSIDVYDFNSGDLISSSPATDKGIVRTVSVIKKILHRK